MLYVDNENVTDPRINLAIEEYLLRHIESMEPILLFYVNEPAVIIGRNQNTIEEIDRDFVEAQNIHVVRRLSGGGAVYHDLGNLNFSFITQGTQNLHNFAKFTDPVVRVLCQLGVPARLHGRSDIFARDKKVSGNAQYSTSKRMFSHGTLLFDTSIENMLRALNPRQVRIESKAVQSVRNFVTNIRELLALDMEIEELKQALLKGIFDQQPVATFPLTPSDWDGIEKIATERYRTWDWNYGRSPRFDIHKSGQFDVGKIDVHINVDEGRIQLIQFSGNFPAQRDLAAVQDRLVGARYERPAIESALADVDLLPYFGPLSHGDLVELIS